VSRAMATIAGVVLELLVVGLPVSLAAGYPATPESATVAAVQAILGSHGDDLAGMADTEALAEFARSFIHCSNNPSGLAFRRKLFGDSAGEGIPDRQLFARVMESVWEKRSQGARLREVAESTRCRILGSVEAGDTTFVVYRLSNPMAPKRPFPVILSLRKTANGYAVLPSLSGQDAILSLGLQSGLE
jgi:hypothetical protein